MKFVIIWPKVWRSGFRPAPDYEPLNHFVEELKRRLEQTKGLYKEFKQAIENANTSSIQSAEDCNCKAHEAKKKKNNTVVKGLLLMGVGVAVAAEVLADGLGSLFGTSLPVGAAISAGGCTVVVAVLVAKFTYIVKDLRNSEKAFKKLSGTFDCLAQHDSDMSTRALQAKGILKVLHMSVGDVERSHDQRKHGTPESLFCALDRLCERFHESSEKVSAFRAKTTELESDLR